MSDPRDERGGRQPPAAPSGRSKEVAASTSGVWRSPVARRLWEPKVPGSNPGAPIEDTGGGPCPPPGSLFFDRMRTEGSSRGAGELRRAMVLTPETSGGGVSPRSSIRAPR